MPADRSHPIPYKPLVARLSWAATRPEALWDAWAFAAVEAELALGTWLKAANHLKEAAFGAYHQALDREELAAADLAARVAPNVGRRLQTRWAVNRSAA